MATGIKNRPGRIPRDLGRELRPQETGAVRLSGGPKGCAAQTLLVEGATTLSAGVGVLHANSAFLAVSPQRALAGGGLMSPVRAFFRSLNAGLTSVAAGNTLGLMGAFGGGGGGYRPVFGRNEAGPGLVSAAFELLRGRFDIDAIMQNLNLTFNYGGQELTLEKALTDYWYWLSVKNNWATDRIEDLGGEDRNVILQRIGMLYEINYAEPFVFDHIKAVVFQLPKEDYFNLASFLAKVIVDEGNDLDALFNPEKFAKRVFQVGEKQMTGAAVLARFVQLQENHRGGRRLSGMTPAEVLKSLPKSGVRSLIEGDNVVARQRSDLGDQGTLGGLFQTASIVCQHMREFALVFVGEHRMDMMEEKEILDHIDEMTGLPFFQILFREERLSWLRKPHDEAKGLVTRTMESVRAEIESLGVPVYLERKGLGVISAIDTGSTLADYAPLFSGIDEIESFSTLVFLTMLGGDVSRLAELDAVVGERDGRTAAVRMTLKDMFRELGFWAIEGAQDGWITLVGGAIIDKGELLLTTGYNYFYDTVLRELALDYLKATDHRIVTADVLTIAAMLGDIVVKEGSGDPAYLGTPGFLDRIFTTSDRRSISGAQVLTRFAKLDRIRAGDATLAGLDARETVAKLGGRQGIIASVVDNNEALALGLRLSRQETFKNTARLLVKEGMELVMKMVEANVRGDWERIKTPEFLDGAFSVVHRTGREAVAYILSCAAHLVGAGENGIVAKPERIAELSSPEELYRAMMKARTVKLAEITTNNVQEALVLFYDAFFYELEADPDKFADFSRKLKSGKTIKDILIELTYWNNGKRLPSAKEEEIDPISQTLFGMGLLIALTNMIVEAAQVDHLPVAEPGGHDYNSLHIFLSYQAAIYGMDFYSRPEFNEKEFIITWDETATGRELLSIYLRLRNEKKGDVPSAEDLRWLEMDDSFKRWVGYITQSPLKMRILNRRRNLFDGAVQLIAAGAPDPEKLRDEAVQKKIAENAPADIEDIFGGLLVSAALLGLGGLEPRIATLSETEAFQKGGGIDAVIRLVKEYARPE